MTKVFEVRRECGQMEGFFCSRSDAVNLRHVVMAASHECNEHTVFTFNTQKCDAALFLSGVVACNVNVCHQC